MGAINKKNLSTVAAKIFVATYANGIPAYTPGTNDDVVKAYIDANFSFSRAASVIDLQISENPAADLVETIADECDTQTIYKAGRPEIVSSCTWYENQNLDVIKVLLGTDVLNVAGTPVAVTAEAHGTGWTVGTPFKLNYKDGDNTIVASIVVKAGVSTLVLNTDYTTYVGNGLNGDLGYTYIVPLTAQTLAITVDYSYTPTATKYTGLKAISQELPRVIVKIQTCADDDGKIDTYYLVDAGINAELVTPFLDVARAGDLVGSSLEIMCNKGGYVLKAKERF